MKKKTTMQKLHSMTDTLKWIRSNQSYLQDLQKSAELRRKQLIDSLDTKSNREALSFTPYKGGLIESDHRRFRPDFRLRRILKTDSTVSRLTSRGKFDTISFVSPDKEFPCLKRKARRRVLFALNLVGKGSQAKRHKWTATSYIDC